MNGLGWSVILVHFIVRDLREKKGVSPIFRIIGWVLFRTSCSPAMYRRSLIESFAVSTALLPFVLRVGRSNPHARLLSFFLGFGVCFIWLAIGFEGLFYVSYSLALCLWVEVESVSREHARDHNVPSRKEEPTNKHDAGTYRPKADDLRIAVFFLFFVQVAFFGTGK